MPDWFLAAWIGFCAGWILGRIGLRIWFGKELDKIKKAFGKRFNQ